jgi:hypothetical protein
MKTYKSAGDQPTEFKLLANRRNLSKLICLGVIFMGFALAGCDSGNVDAAAEINSKEESNMESIQSATTIQTKIPPIDAAVIPETETATFAMG